MTDFTIASFNVRNLIEADQEYYRFESYTPEEYAWKRDWLADQLQRMNADIVGFQEIFSEAALREVIAEADRDGIASNATAVPDPSRRYARKAIFRKLAYTPYTDAAIAFAPNVSDDGPGHRRPGVAILSRFGFVGEPEIIQQLPEPVEIPFHELAGGDAGSYRLTRLSRPVLRVQVPVGGMVLTVYNCHLKSKLGEYDRPKGAWYAPAEDLVNYDPAARALGSLRSGLRRMAEAWVLRRRVLQDLDAGHPVMVLGDFNDGEHAVSTEILCGEAPFRDYAWLRRHDARHAADRYTPADSAAIRAQVEAVRLHPAERLFARASSRDMIYTSIFAGVFESIDQILMSRHFAPDNPDRLADLDYFTALNDHLTDGSHPEAPFNKLVSDHGQIMAHLRLRGSAG